MDATTTHSNCSCRSESIFFLIRRMHSLTGLMFGMYLIVHLTVNASLLEGIRHKEAFEKFGVETSNIFQQQVDKIHSIPFLVPVEWMFILLPIIFHALYGIFITVNGRPNLAEYQYPRNTRYYLQRVSAAMLIGFIAFHVLGMKGFLQQSLVFEPVKYAAESTVYHINAAWWVAYIIYPVGVICAAFHTGNGFWGAGITWGLATSKGAQKRWGFVSAAIGLALASLGLAAWFASVSVGKPTATPWLH